MFSKKNFEEIWAGRRLFVCHLRIFGCMAYSYVPNQLRKKFDDKRKMCVFIGYSEVFRTYKFYNLLTEKVIVNKDVTFDERCEFGTGLLKILK